jgi:hypothetical protein
LGNVGSICHFAGRRQWLKVREEFKMTLTVEELQEKIKQVTEDIEKNSQNIHATEVLTSYKEYLKDELKMLGKDL